MPANHGAAWCAFSASRGQARARSDTGERARRDEPDYAQSGGAYPDTNKKFPVAIVTLELEYLVGNNRTQLMILLISVVVVLDDRLPERGQSSPGAGQQAKS